MPELPEVEVLSSQLKSALTGLKISRIERMHEDLLECPAKILKENLPNRTIRDVGRQGKYVQIVFDDGACLWLHLGMTGQILFRDKPGVYSPYTQLVLSFWGKNQVLIFEDIRKFGRIGYSPCEKLPDFILSLGPDPFTISENLFVENFKTRTGRIKSLLLNQKIVSGLGNIYADESLYRAMIHPNKRACRVKNERLKVLYQKIQEVLGEAIRAGGSSIDDFRHTNGESGRYQNRHRVYGREGKECLGCGRAIRRIVLSGRSSHFCPNCQK